MNNTTTLHTDDDGMPDVGVALRAFDIVRRFGAKQEGWYVLDDIRVQPSYDGYTLYLANDDGCLSVFFHHKFSAEFSSQRDYERFLQKLEYIDKTRYGTGGHA